MNTGFLKMGFISIPFTAIGTGNSKHQPVAPFVVAELNMRSSVSFCFYWFNWISLPFQAIAGFIGINLATIKVNRNKLACL